jgi:hypothetical protein
VLLTAVPFLRRMTWSLPDTYHSAGHGRGTATLKFYEGRDILAATTCSRLFGFIARELSLLALFKSVSKLT